MTVLIISSVLIVSFIAPVETNSGTLPRQPGPNLYSTVQSPSQNEAETYRSWYEANAANDIRKAYDLAKIYLKSFPNGSNAGYLTKWLPRSRGLLINEALKSRNIGEAMRLGNEQLETDSENIDFLTVLATNIATSEIFANPPSYSHAAEAADFSRRVIKLVELGKKPSTVTEPWNQKQFVAYFYQVLAAIEEFNKNTDKALDYYVKAGNLEPTNPRHFFGCGRLHQEKYLKALEKYSSFPEADRNAATLRADVKAALDEANRAADAVIECWVTFLRLTAAKNDFGPTREKVEKAVADLYAYRHPDSPGGFRQLIKP